MKFILSTYRLISRTYRLISSETGNMALFYVLSLSTFLGFMGLSLDMGMLYTARTQLQNASDAAAMAGAGDLIKDLDGDAIADSNYDGAESTVISLVEANSLLSHMISWQHEDTFIAGLWDKDVNDFIYTGDTEDTNELNAVHVQLTRPIDTFFMKIFGIHNVVLSAQSIAFLECAGNGTRADLPIAINEAKLNEPFKIIVLNNENEENGQWTSFETWPVNKNTINPFILGKANGGDDPPLMSIGDDIYMNNGVIVPLFTTLKNRFNNEKNEDNEYSVCLPVVRWQPPQNRGTLVGYVHFVITDVRTSGGNDGKQIIGYMHEKSIIADGSMTGGKCFGVRATRSVMLH
ncbi:hypothetical protein MHK_009872 [Candidatus Magnetomorum sp. HK-1]|nr:hypothetical protein MHK_009872 [Candidatus Magnetomorum sp. HK-1]